MPETMRDGGIVTMVDNVPRTYIIY